MTSVPSRLCYVNKLRVQTSLRQQQPRSSAVCSVVLTNSRKKRKLNEERLDLARCTASLVLGSQQENYSSRPLRGGRTVPPGGSSLGNKNFKTSFN